MYGFELKDDESLTMLSVIKIVVRNEFQDYDYVVLNSCSDGLPQLSYVNVY